MTEGNAGRKCRKAEHDERKMKEDPGGEIKIAFAPHAT
jgi:hypothetical protein